MRIQNCKEVTIVLLLFSTGLFSLGCCLQTSHTKNVSNEQGVSFHRKPCNKEKIDINIQLRKCDRYLSVSVPQLQTMLLLSVLVPWKITLSICTCQIIY